MVNKIDKTKVNKGEDDASAMDKDNIFGDSSLLERVEPVGYTSRGEARR